MVFVDTNYFLRYLLNDISEQHTEAKNLFVAGSEGKIELITSLIVFFEIFWVLRSFYEVDKPQLISSLQKILKLSFIQLDEREILLGSLSLFERTNLDLEDCYNVYYAKSRGIKTNDFRTFDKKLEKEFNK
jgi:predicted nucleic acid-binding protein